MITQGQIIFGHINRILTITDEDCVAYFTILYYGTFENKRLITLNVISFSGFQYTVFKKLFHKKVRKTWLRVHFLLSQHDDLLVNEFDDSVGHGDDVTAWNAGKKFCMDPVIPTGWHIARFALFLNFIL